MLVESIKLLLAFLLSLNWILFHIAAPKMDRELLTHTDTDIRDASQYPRPICIALGLCYGLILSLHHSYTRTHTFTHAFELVTISKIIFLFFSPCRVETLCKMILSDNKIIKLFIISEARFLAKWHDLGYVIVCATPIQHTLVIHLATCQFFFFFYHWQNRIFTNMAIRSERA